MVPMVAYANPYVNRPKFPPVEAAVAGQETTTAPRLGAGEQRGEMMGFSGSKLSYKWLFISELKVKSGENYERLQMIYSKLT